jgi:hypothetical protein
MLRYCAYKIEKVVIDRMNEFSGEKPLSRLFV